MSDIAFNGNALKQGFGDGAEKNSFCMADANATHKIDFFERHRQSHALKSLQPVSRCA